jgi:hypothetical protein
MSPYMKIRHVGEMWVTAMVSDAAKVHLLLQANSTKGKCVVLVASFSSTPQMTSSTTTSQAPQRISPGFCRWQAQQPLHNFHEMFVEAPTAKPTRRSPSNSNKQLMATHLSAREELQRKNKGGDQQLTPRSRSHGFPSLREGIDWWKL